MSTETFTIIDHNASHVQCVDVLGQKFWMAKSDLDRRLRDATVKEFSEEQHPRDDHGRWTSGGGETGESGEQTRERKGGSLDAPMKVMLDHLEKATGYTTDQIKEALTGSLSPNHPDNVNRRAAIVGEILKAGTARQDAVMQILAAQDKTANDALVEKIGKGDIDRLKKELGTVPHCDVLILGGLKWESHPVQGQANCQLATRVLTMGKGCPTGDARHELGHAMLSAWCGGSSGPKTEIGKVVSAEYDKAMAKAKADPSGWVGKGGKKLDHEWYENNYGIAGSRGLDSWHENCAEQYRLYCREIYRDRFEGGNGKLLAQYRERHPEWAKIWDAHYTAALLGLAMAGKVTPKQSDGQAVPSSAAKPAAPAAAKPPKPSKLPISKPSAQDVAKILGPLGYGEKPPELENTLSDDATVPPKAEKPVAAPKPQGKPTQDGIGAALPLGIWNVRPGGKVEVVLDPSGTYKPGTVLNHQQVAELINKPMQPTASEHQPLSEERKPVAPPENADKMMVWTGSLKKGEQAKVKEAAQRWITEDGVPYKEINDALRTGGTIPSKLQATYDTLQKAIKEHGTDPGVTLYHGLKLPSYGKYTALMGRLQKAMKSGEPFTMRGIVSASTRPEVAEKYCHQKGAGTVLEIRAKALPIAGFGTPSETEHLIAHGTQYQVVGMGKAKYPTNDGKKRDMVVVQLQEV